ncbi:MAG: tetratricopeptide repeat protein, partial [Candidatus Sumerlaeota bacterium]|nr:tetratricopeptide repeat protein [Candidatus Sumerlaeota bacterium]
MIAISSRSAGVLVLPNPDTGEYAVLDLIEGEQHDPIDAQYIYSAAQDWEEIENSDAKTLIEAASREYWLARTVSLLLSAIRGLEENLEKRVLEHVEELLGSRVSSETALDRLLVAPLVDPRSPLPAAKSALSCNFSAVASILENLAELQPLLHRFADLWLRLPATAFGGFSESRETIWTTLIEKGRMRSLLEAGNRRDFTTQWNLLAFHFASYQSRSGIGLLGQEMSRLLFPEGEHVEIMDVPLAQRTESVPGHQRDRATNVYEAFESVKKQITAIAQAVSQGHDAKAEKFLKELIQEQTSSSQGEGFAVKSLCNIAQRCADMFRMDFEAICLDEALRLHPLDPWALIQYGDHLKRIGKYDQAIETLDRAEQFGKSDIARSSKADVYSQQGDYARAIHTYETISGWSEKPILRTAMADNLRKMGRLEEAQQAYEELIGSLQQGLPDFASSEARALAGMAETAKKQGKFEVALGIYYSILERGGIEDRDRPFYKLRLGSVLKLMGQFPEAYKVVDEVIQQYPFAMEARFTRGS